MRNFILIIIFSCPYLGNCQYFELSKNSINPLYSKFIRENNYEFDSCIIARNKIKTITEVYKDDSCITEYDRIGRILSVVIFKPSTTVVKEQRSYKYVNDSIKITVKYPDSISKIILKYRNNKFVSCFFINPNSFTKNELYYNHKGWLRKIKINLNGKNEKPFRFDYSCSKGEKRIIFKNANNSMNKYFYFKNELLVRMDLFYKNKMFSSKTILYDTSKRVCIVKHYTPSKVAYNSEDFSYEFYNYSNAKLNKIERIKIFESTICHGSTLFYYNSKNLIEKINPSPDLEYPNLIKYYYSFY